LGIKTPVEIIPNGVDLKRFRPQQNPAKSQSLRQRFGIGADDCMIISIGGIMPRKGSDLLVEAWARLAPDHPGLHLVLVGPRKDLEQPGLKQFGRKLENRIQTSGAAERVHFTGLSDEVEALLRASDIFVLPSEREGMPNSVLEAMASRVPVVITPFKGLSEDLGEAGTHYLLSERTPAALTSSLQRLLDDTELRQQLAHQGYHWVTRTMSLDKSLDRYAAMYHRMAGKNKTHGC